MITLLQLQYFQSLAKEQHLTKTAEKLFISQTTLSATIIKLEKELGTQLFDRKGGSIRLNEQGEKYLQYVNGALLMLSDGENAMKAYQTGKHSESMSMAICNTNVWGSTIISFLKQYPNYSIRQKSEVLPGMHENLLSGKLDMAIAAVEDLDDTRLDYCVLQTGRVCIALPHGHRLEGRQELFIKDLIGESIISLPRSFPFSVFCERIFRKAGYEPQIIAECDYPMRPRLLANGLGVVPLQSTTLKSIIVSTLYHDFTCLPLMDDFAIRRPALLWLKGRKLTPIMRDFIDFIQPNCQNDS